MGGLSNYPPGHPTGNEASQVRLVCRNEDCPEEGAVSEVTLIYERETGARYLDPEEAAFCDECGNERDDA